MNGSFSNRNDFSLRSFLDLASEGDGLGNNQLPERHSNRQLRELRRESVFRLRKRKSQRIVLSFLLSYLLLFLMVFVVYIHLIDLLPAWAVFVPLALVFLKNMRFAYKTARTATVNLARVARKDIIDSTLMFLYVVRYQGLIQTLGVPGYISRDKSSAEPPGKLVFSGSSCEPLPSVRLRRAKELPQHCNVVVR